MSDYFDSDADEASDTPAPEASAPEPTVDPAEDSQVAEPAAEDVTVHPVDGFEGTLSVAAGEPVEVSGPVSVPANVAALLVETGKVEVAE